jgi:hypothetical protein
MELPFFRLFCTTTPSAGTEACDCCGGADVHRSSPSNSLSRVPLAEGTALLLSWSASVSSLAIGSKPSKRGSLLPDCREVNRRDVMLGRVECRRSCGELRIVDVGETSSPSEGKKVRPLAEASSPPADAILDLCAPEAHVQVTALGRLSGLGDVSEESASTCDLGLCCARTRWLSRRVGFQEPKSHDGVLARQLTD